jgi:hypothetical protein
MGPHSQSGRQVLRRIARAAMLERGLLPEFSAVSALKGAAGRPAAVGADLGERLRMRLIHTDVERGFIDFARAG